jgi:hypothetical protein
VTRAGLISVNGASAERPPHTAVIDCGAPSEAFRFYARQALGDRFKLA